MEDLSKYNPEGSLLRNTQHRMIHILQEVDAICRRHNIEYFLDGGSLLGAVRHQGFIPWDDDLDITIMARDYKSFRKYLTEELPGDLVFQDVRNDPNIPFLFGKVRDKNSYFEEDYTSRVKEKGIYIDVFPKEFVLSFTWKKKLDYFYGHCFRSIHNYYTQKDKVLSVLIYPFAWLAVWLTRIATAIVKPDIVGNIYGQWSYAELHYDDLFPVQDIKFEDVITRAPANPDAVLKAYFGDYMQIPPEDKRPRHSGKIEIY